MEKLKVPEGEFFDWALATIQQGQLDTIRLIGEFKALRFTVQVLIATHPEPKSLLAAWSKASALLSEQLATGATDDAAAAHHKGWQEGLGRMAREIHAAAADEG